MSRLRPAWDGELNGGPVTRGRIDVECPPDSGQPLRDRVEPHVLVIGWKVRLARVESDAVVVHLSGQHEAHVLDLDGYGVGPGVLTCIDHQLTCGAIGDLLDLGREP